MSQETKNSPTPSEEIYWQRLMDKPLSRRKALAVTAGTAFGAVLLAACGGGGSTIEEPTPGNTTEDGNGQVDSPPTKNPESKFSPDSFRELARGVNNKVAGTTVDGAEDYRSTLYQKASEENFSMVFTTGAMMQTTIDEHGDRWSGYFRDLADRSDQVFYAHPGIWHQDAPERMKNASLEDIRTYEEQRAEFFFSRVKPVDSGVKPTFINFLNEAAFTYLDGAGRVVRGWSQSPSFRLHGTKIISDLYLLFERKGREKGFTLGKDYFLAYSDYDTYVAGPKQTFILELLTQAKKDIAAELGTAQSEVLLDVALQCHFDVTSTSGLTYHRVPSEEELSASIKRFANIGRVHLTEFDVRGTQDQNKKTEIMSMVTKVFKDSPEVISLCYWNSLRQKPRVAGDEKTFWPNGLFDPTYQPTEAYKQVAAVYTS